MNYIRLKDICRYYLARPSIMNLWLENIAKGQYGVGAVIWAMEQSVGDYSRSELSPADKEYLYKRLTELINTGFRY